MEGLVAVLLFVLKLVGWLLLAVLAILLIALIIPVGAQFVFAGRQLVINAKAGPVQFRVFPFKAKKPAQEQPEPGGEPGAGQADKAGTGSQNGAAGPEGAEQPKDAPDGTQKPEKAEKSEGEEKAAQPKAAPAEKRAEPSISQPPPDKAPKRRGKTETDKKAAPAKPPKPKKQRGKKQSAGGGGGAGRGGLAGLPWRRIAAALQLLPWTLKKIIGSLRLYDLHLVIPVHGKDAAATAITYGRLNAALGVFLAVLQNLCRPDIRQLDVICDYTGEQAGREYFSCKLTTHLLSFAILAVVLFVKLKRRKII